MNRSTKNILRWWGRMVVPAICVLIIMIPIYLVIIGGFMTVQEIYRQPPHLFPPNPTWQFYQSAWNTLNQSMLNSFIIAIGTYVLTLAVSTPTAFALAKLRMSVEKPVSFAMALVQMLPMTTLVIPLFLIFFNVGLNNTFTGVVLGISAFTVPFCTILLTAYMRSIPSGLMEAAWIDGASLGRIFVSIVLPISSPGIATAGMFAFLMAWGNFIFPLSLLQERSLQPMSVALYRFVDQFGIEWNMLMAGSAIYSIPPILVVLVAGRYLVSGMTAGAFKE